MSASQPGPRHERSSLGSVPFEKPGYTMIFRPRHVGRLSALLLGALLVTLSPSLRAAPKAKTPAKKKPAAGKYTGPQFIRIVRDEKTKQPIRMETATIRYVPGKESKRPPRTSIDLIGVVHIGERGYYSQLNRRFKQYDALLYELVANPGEKPPKNRSGSSNNPIGALQNGMKSMLELEHQLEHIDYTKKNFVHADLSPEQMAEAIRKRGDNGLTITLGVLFDMLRQQNLAQARAKKNKKDGQAVEQVDLLTLLTDPNGPIKMKRMMAEQMAQMETTGGVGKTLDRILITDRNQAAMKVVVKQLKRGKHKLGVFYGAAHMPDFHQRLVAMGYRPGRVEWTKAWDLEIKKDSPPSEFILLLRLLQQLSR